MCWSRKRRRGLPSGSALHTTVLPTKHPVAPYRGKGGRHVWNKRVGSRTRAMSYLFRKQYVHPYQSCCVPMEPNKPHHYYYYSKLFSLSRSRAHSSWGQSTELITDLQACSRRSLPSDLPPLCIWGFSHPSPRRPWNLAHMFLKKELVPNLRFRRNGSQNWTLTLTAIPDSSTKLTPKDS